MKYYNCDRCKQNIAGEAYTMTLKEPKSSFTLEEINLTRDLCNECYLETRVFLGDYRKIENGEYEVIRDTKESK